VVSLATSASKARHSPPDCCAIANRLLSGGEIVVDCQHVGAFPCKAQNRGTAVAQPFARRLTGAYYNGDLILQTHANLIARLPVN
jgi:hypothetical protein